MNWETRNLIDEFELVKENIKTYVQRLVYRRLPCS